MSDEIANILLLNTSKQAFGANILDAKIKGE